MVGEIQQPEQRIDTARVTAATVYIDSDGVSILLLEKENSRGELRDHLVIDRAVDIDGSLGTRAVALIWDDHLTPLSFQLLQLSLILNISSEGC